MAIIKKKNPETGQWVPWAASSASGIYSINPLLLENSEQYVTVDQALVRNKEDIELLKKNVAWLALHGGGGSGGGGGSSEVENSIEFINNGDVVTSILWTENSKSVDYRLLSSKTSTRFTVTILLDGTQIWSGTGLQPSATNVRSVQIRNINAYSSNAIHRLRIIATDAFGNEIYADCTIAELSVKILVPNSINVNRTDFETSGLNVSYSASEIGIYNLYYSRDKDLYKNLSLAEGVVELNIPTTSMLDYTIPYTELLHNVQTIATGQTFDLYFILVNASDSVLHSEQANSTILIVSPDNIAVAKVSLSTDISNPAVVSKSSVLYANFIAYLAGGSAFYRYNISAQEIELSGEEWINVGEPYTIITDGRGEYGRTTVVQYNEFPSVSWFRRNAYYRITTSVTDVNNPSKTGSLDTYIFVSSGAGETLPVDADYNNIFDFYVFGSNATINSWVSTNDSFLYNNAVRTVTTELEMFNMGGKSIITSSHCRFSNKAHGIIQPSVLNGVSQKWFPESTSNGLISAQRPQFTLSISYYNDFTPDDNRTILKLGNYVPESYENGGVATGTGILINNHDYYIQLGGSSSRITGKLQDSIFQQIDIVFGEVIKTTNNGTSVFVKVYQNGVLLQTVETQDSYIYAFRNFNQIFLGCDENQENYTNFNLQSIALWNTCLNPYQITCRWINNLARYNLTGENNNELNYDIIEEKMRSNLIVYDSSTEKFSCALWNNGGFNDKQWINISNNTISLSSNLADAAKIPVVVLDFSTSTNWTWDNFTQVMSASGKIPPAENVAIYYFVDGVNVLPAGTTCTVEIQGTTTTGYTIKNVDIDFGENRLFWAKSDWFPERVYTLKADVVDSAHANNACIGRFINKCAEVGIIDPTPAMEYYDANKSSNNFIIPSTCNASIKHTLEGFPVLLICRFYSAVTTDVRSLGIYSFNLGRSAYFNLGFKILNKFRNISGDVLGDSSSAPMLLGAPVESTDVIDMNAESWEGADSLNCDTKPIDYEPTSEMEQEMPVRPTGYFWSSLEGHIRHFWNNKYPGGAPIAGFQELFRELVLHPYAKGNLNLNIGTSFKEYDWSAARGFFIPDGAEPKQMGRVGDGGAQSIKFNIKNARFYYIVCLLAGLVDNLGKNLNMRTWRRGLGSYISKWFTSFYDMDTAFGIDNAGYETVKPDVFDETLYNIDDVLVNGFVAGDETSDNIYTVKDAKLWGILDSTEFKRQYDDLSGDSSYNSLYAQMWNEIREKLIPSVDSFMDDFFGMQTEGIGELIYNQDFTVKYVNTTQKNFMHGDRKAFVRDWLNKRIKFLDSIFGYKQRNGNNAYLTNITTIKDASYNKKVIFTHNSGTERIPFVSNCPIIVSSSIGQDTINYYYLPTNTPVNVRVANSGNNKNIQTTINNADCILDIDNLKDLQIRAIAPSQIGAGDGNIDTSQYGALSSFTNFDMSGNTSFNNDGIDFIKLFKTWNEGDATKPYSLKSINLSNTKSPNVTSFPLSLTAVSDMIYANPFENLTDIDITNSCVTSVSLPDGVSLFTLNVAGSAVRNVELRGQSIIDNVDFTGCSALNTLVLNQCSVYRKLSLMNMASLQNVTVSECPALTEIEIDCNKSKNNLILNVSDTPNLTSVKINGCYGTSAQISLAGATQLEELDLSDCYFGTVYLPIECRDTLRVLNLSASRIKSITWITPSGSVITDTLNLKGCTALESLSLGSNVSVEYVQFDNIEDEPIIINSSFSGCTSLKRVYGNVRINCSSAFSGCSQFSILGSSLSEATFNGESAMDGDYIKHFTDDVSSNEAIHFEAYVPGDGVTNMTFQNTTATSSFESTSCTNFDVYYILWNIGNATGLADMFRHCKNVAFTCTETVDNSPHWTMFNKCGRVTTVNSMFYSTGSNNFRIFTMCSSHQGLFSPLASCKNYGTIFYSSRYISDRRAFEGLNGSNLPATVIAYFSPILIVANVNTLDTASTYARLTTPSDYLFGSGNISNFFRYIPGLSGTMDSLFYNTAIIDYDTFSKIPATVTTVRGCFISTNGKGTLNVQNLFENKSKVINIYHSFRVSSSSNSTVTMPIDDQTFSGFSNLTRVGYIASGSNVGSATNTAFSGSGIVKVIQGNAFPYDIIRNSGAARKLVMFTGFFKNASFENPVGTVELPGTLFTGCSSLENVEHCFYNFNNPYQLTSDGFVGTKLKQARYCFASDNSQLIGEIPRRLFNLGFTTSTRTLRGTTETSRTKTVTFDSQSVIGNYLVLTSAAGTEVVDGETVNVQYRDSYTYCSLEGDVLTYTPLSEITREVQYWQNNNWTTVSSTTEYVDDTWTVTSVSYDISLPKNTITDLTGCFAGVNCDPYVCLEPTVENNPTYCPYEYLVSGGVWTRANKDENDKTYMWEFDGCNYIDETGNSYLSLDEFTEEDDVFASWHPLFDNSATPVLNFCAPPDLLRWCTSNASVAYMFTGAGHDTNGTLSYSSHLSGPYGLKGRICPYMLKPVPNTTSIQEMFAWCTHLYSYNINGQAYLIPPSFFSYAPKVTNLSYAFEGVSFLKNPQLYEVFSKLTGSLNVRQIFYHAWFAEGSANDKTLVTNVFSRNNVANAYGAFAQSNMKSTPNETRDNVSRQYVAFNNVFGKSTNNNEYYVFDGYNPNTVTHESPRTVSTAASRHNYRTF